MGTVHIDVATSLSAKRLGAPSGDVTHVERSPERTLVVLADGLGHGLPARVAARMAVSRLVELTRRGFSVAAAFARLVDSMERHRGESRTYAALSVLRVRPDGRATVLAYDAPPPVAVGPLAATVLPGRTERRGDATLFEAELRLEPGDGVLLFSDGVAQAGLGRGLAGGWTSEGVARFVSDLLTEASKRHRVPELVERRARELWGAECGDDVGVLHASARRGEAVTLLTGPPLQRGLDRTIARRVDAAEGARIVCGASTAKMVARALRRELHVEQESATPLTPPAYTLEGFDLVTEGAVTLNQAYNLLGEERGELAGPADALCTLLEDADHVTLLHGRAPSSADDTLVLRQLGILPRATIVPLLAEKLRTMGKLVVIDAL